MTLPKPFYEVLKFLANFIPGITAIISGLLITLGSSEHTATVVVFCVSALGQIIIIFVNVAAKNHWKAVASDGTTEDIEEIEESAVVENATDYDDDIDE